MIRAENITVTYKTGFRKRLKALDGFSLSIQEGDIFAILGRNGAGKSTAMYCFLGLIQPDSGHISISGQRPFPGARLFRDISYLPEEPHYHQYLTVEEAIYYYASLYGTTVRKEKIDEVMELLELSEHRHLRISKCSKGMKQKVGIAQCLVNTPRILFLDEPTRGLDPVTVKKFRDLLLDLNQKGCTIVINSHILSEVELICKRFAVVEKGRVVVEDELDHIKHISTDLYYVEFDYTDTLPECVRILSRKDTTIKGTIPATRLEEFMEFLWTNNLQLYECSMKRKSLEDIVVSVFERKKDEESPSN